MEPSGDANQPNVSSIWMALIFIQLAFINSNRIPSWPCGGISVEHGREFIMKHAYTQQPRFDKLSRARWGNPTISHPI